MLRKSLFDIPTVTGTLASVALSIGGIAIQSSEVHAATFGSISQIYAYGDSYSDNGAYE